MFDLFHEIAPFDCVGSLDQNMIMKSTFLQTLGEDADVDQIRQCLFDDMFQDVTRRLSFLPLLLLVLFSSLSFALRHTFMHHWLWCLSHDLQLQEVFILIL